MIFLQYLHTSTIYLPLFSDTSPYNTKIVWRMVQGIFLHFDKLNICTLHLTYVNCRLEVIIIMLTPFVKLIKVSLLVISLSSSFFPASSPFSHFYVLLTTYALSSLLTVHSLFLFFSFSQYPGYSFYKFTVWLRFTSN